MRSISSLGGCVGRDRHRAEAGALGLRRSGLDLRPPGTRRRPRSVAAWAPAGGSSPLRRGERAHLLLQVLELGRERPDLRLDAVEATGIGGADRGRRTGALPAAGRGGRGGGAARQRFERADHHLHVDQLLLELLDALAQGAIARRRSLARRAGGSLCRRLRASPARLALRRLLLGQEASGPMAVASRAAAPRRGQKRSGIEVMGAFSRFPVAGRPAGREGQAAVARSVLFNTTLERPQGASQLRRRGDRRAARSLRGAGPGAPVAAAVSTGGPMTVTARRFCAAHAASAHSAIRRSRP